MGKVSHPILLNLSRANLINQAHGAPVIAAWEVEDLPDDWIYTMTKSIYRINKISADMSEIEKIKSAWRARHPTYGKTRAH